MPNLEKERELFEVEYKKQKHTFNDSFCKFENGCYMNEKVSIAWGVWLASASREGYVLVPINPTQKMIEAAIIEKQKHGRTDSDLYKAMLGAANET